MKIPKSAIEWIVNRLHVGTSEELVRADIRARAEKAGAPWTEAKIVEAENYAVKCHKRNRDLYNSVMTGKF